MRPLRAVVDKLAFEFDAEDQSLFLQLSLLAGCYVTTMLDHFITLRDAS